MGFHVVDVATKHVDSLQYWLLPITCCSAVLLGAQAALCRGATVKTGDNAAVRKVMRYAQVYQYQSGLPQPDYGIRAWGYGVELRAHPIDRCRVLEGDWRY